MKTNSPFTSILGVHITATSYREVLNKISGVLRNQKSGYICVSAVHLVMECQKDPSLLKGVNNAMVVTPDGMPLVWLSHLYGHHQVERVYGPTLSYKMCELTAQKKYRVFLLGGKKGQSKDLAGTLKKHFPTLQIVGHRDTPIRPLPLKQNQAIVKEIKSSRAQIVFVGMGCPLQEKWMIENSTQLPHSLLIGVGAAFNFLTGEVAQAPDWMQNAGLEWFFRLLQEPRRLAYRYTVLNGQFLWLISLQLLRDFVLKKLNHYAL